MDNSWWLEVSGTRLLIDPWLEGVEVDGFRWFNIQWHRTAPLEYEALPGFDAVLITQKYPDHFHEETLRRLAPRVLLVPASIRGRVERLLPKAQILAFGPEATQMEWGGLRFSWLPTRRRIDPIYDALVIDDGEQSVLVATHGIELDDRHEASLAQASRCHLLLSPFNHYRLPAIFGGVVTPGLEGLERLVARLKPKWVAQTHDEDKHARGLIPRLARIQRFDAGTLEEIAWLRDRHLAMPAYEEVEL